MKAMKLAVLFVIFGFSIANADVVLVPDFRVDQDPTPNDISGVASSLTYGYFVVSYTFTNPPTYISQCYVRRFDLNGVPLGNPFRVDSLSGSTACFHADVTIDTNGNMIFTWSDSRSGSEHAYFRRFDISETPLNPDTQMDQGANASMPMIAPLPGGGFVSVWDDTRSPGGSIYGRIYDTSGSPVASDFRIDQNPDVNNSLGESSNPAIATSPTGQIYVAWNDGRNRGLPPGNIYARLFDSSLTPLGNDFQVDQSPNGVSLSSIGTVPNGNFMVAWQDYREEGDFGPSDGFGRVFDSSGSPITSDFKLLQSVAGDSSATPDVTADMTGRFTVASWGFAACGGLCMRHFDSAGQYMDIGMLISVDAAYPKSVAVGSQSILTVFDSDRTGNPEVWANITGPDQPPIPFLSLPILIILAFLLLAVIVLKDKITRLTTFLVILFLIAVFSPADVFSKDGSLIFRCDPANPCGCNPTAWAPCSVELRPL